MPMLMATTLTFPERVTEHNMEKLKQRILNGENCVHTGVSTECVARWANDTDFTLSVCP